MTSVAGDDDPWGDRWAGRGGSKTAAADIRRVTSPTGIRGGTTPVTTAGSDPPPEHSHGAMHCGPALHGGGSGGGQEGGRASQITAPCPAAVGQSTAIAARGPADRPSIHTASHACLCDTGRGWVVGGDGAGYGERAGLNMRGDGQGRDRAGTGR